MGKFAIDNPHMELGCRYCGSLAFRSSSSAYFGLFLHTNETTNLPRRFRFSRFLGPYPISLQLAGQAFAQRLFLPVRPHVDMATARAALGTHNLAGKARHLGIVRVLRHVDQALVAAGIVEAGGDEALHPKMPHVA